MRTALILPIAILAAECLAEDPDFTPRWYFGGGISSTRAGDTFADPSNDDVGFVITGGYQFTRSVALEIGYNDAGTPGFTTTITRACGELGSCAVSVEHDTKAFDVSIAGYFSFGEIAPLWQMYVKGGAAFWDASNKQVVTTLSSGSSTTTRIDTDGVSGMLGVGAGRSIGDHTYARLDIEFFSMDGELPAIDRSNTIEQVAFEVHWSF
jgi:hypothetical protein